MTSQKGYSLSRLNCNAFEESAHFVHYAVESPPSAGTHYEAGCSISKTQSGKQITQIWSKESWVES